MTYHETRIDEQPGPRASLQRLGERLFDYLASRKPEHWVMFAAGLILGLLVG